MKLSDFKFNQTLLRLPQFGRLKRCTDRGFAFIEGKKGDVFVHVSDHLGQRLESLEPLEDRPCAFVVGGHPFKFSQKKQDWNKAVVQWYLLPKETGDFAENNYFKERSKALSALDHSQLISLLGADWYRSAWQKRAGTGPRASLESDALLDSLVEDSLDSVGELERLISLLAAVCNSPWYSVSKECQLQVFKRFDRGLNWRPSVLSSSRPLDSIPHFGELPQEVGDEIARRVLAASAVAIDIESDSEKVFQYGWRNSIQTDRREAKGGLTKIALQEAVTESISGVSAPVIIGHNLKAWDLPILKERGAEFPVESTYWDTLIVSWLLEPWKKTHALIVLENAHQADSDASSCFQLYMIQRKRLQPILGDVPTGIESLLEGLENKPSALSEIEDRNYPSQYSASQAENYVIPRSKRKEISWQAGTKLHYESSESALNDPVLWPEVCANAAKASGEINLRVVAVVVENASQNDVEVRLSDLPQWLIGSESRAALRNAHQEFDGKGWSHSATQFFIAEDILKLEDRELDSFISSQEVAVRGSYEVAAAWQKSRRRTLSEQRVDELFPDLVESTNIRALWPLFQNKQPAGWLMFDPAGVGKRGVSWSIWPNSPDWLEPDVSTSSDTASGISSVVIPRWTDGDVKGLSLDRVFVTPNTANRELYQFEVAHCALNLLKEVGETKSILIAMRCAGEADELQKNLQTIGVATSHDGSPLRRLEHAITKGFSVHCCAMDRVADFVSAAQAREVELVVAVTEVPLHEWASIHIDQDSPISAQKNLTSSATSTDIGLEESSGMTEPITYTNQVDFKVDRIQELVTNQLNGWIRGLIGNNTSNLSSVMILDSRFFENRIANRLNVQGETIPFFQLAELLDDKKYEAFERVCFPRLEKSVPESYEDYRRFLEQNWGFPDFRDGTQKPVIEKIIENDRDILVRLPTGAGKSIIFHLPALYRSSYTGRLSVVITPLRALMRDQAQGLWGHQFSERVDYLSGGRDPALNAEVYQGILDGRIHMVFVAPERFRIPRFQEALHRRRRMDGGLEFIVFDETHCVSEWGFEFRPDYLYAGKYVADWFKKKELPGNPHRLLLTSATVTQRNRLDLERELELGKAGEYEDMPEDMPHPIQPYIQLGTHECDEDESAPRDEKFEKTLQLLEKLDLSSSAALVFVQRRKDCHRLAEALNEYALEVEDEGLSQLSALPFHAGLPESVKAEAADLLRERKANVLVCTKAFGMGMDIPHLHTCVHHRPPTFIEDYLQEVGRIGRDAGERERSGHELVSAELLYNQSDISRNLNFLHEETIKPPDLQEFFDYCIESTDRLRRRNPRLCIIPACVQLNESTELSESKVAKSLFWLERMDMLTVEGRVKPTLQLKMDMDGLSRLAKGKDRCAPVAKTLVRFVNDSQSLFSDYASGGNHEIPHEGSEGVLSRMIRGILSGALSLVSPSQPTRPIEREVQPAILFHESNVTDGWVKVEVQLEQLLAGSGVSSVDELFEQLLVLCASQVLIVERNLVVSKSSVPSEEEIWGLIEMGTELLLQSTDGAFDVIPRNQLVDELKRWYTKYLLGYDLSEEENIDFSQVDSTVFKRIERETYRAINVSLAMARYSDVKIEDVLNDDLELQYGRAITQDVASKSLFRAKKTLNQLKTFVDFVQSNVSGSFGDQGTFELPITDVLHEMGEEVRYSKLEKLINLAERAGLFGFQNELDYWGSLVSLNSMEQLQDHEPEDDTDTLVQRVYREMLEKNNLQILRAHSMVLLSAMPQEGKKEFIDGYFDCTNAEELKALLEDTVGEVDDDVLSNDAILSDLLVQVRQERFTVEFERLNSKQLEVCRAPHKKHLLVNAGPGSGKTHVLMMRCAHLIHRQGISPSDILVLAFNRAVVYEIRDRIRTLFKALGYGNYVNKLDVSTFHSFALRFQESTDRFEEEAIGDAVHQFANRVAKDEQFAKLVAGKYRAILVDEFQDMNEDFYRVVVNLLKYSKAGGMVIGDDDQDILTWNRRIWQKQHRQDCPLDGAHYFKIFSEKLSPSRHELTLNYRSVPEIVQRSNSMIEKVSTNVGFQRMKQDVELHASRRESGTAQIPFDVSDLSDLVTESLNQGENVAILCRSNLECRQVYDDFINSGSIDSNRVELLGAEDFSLYQLRSSGAMMDLCSKRKDYEFIDNYIWNELIDEFREGGFADSNKGVNDLNLLFELVRAEVGRPRIRDFNLFVQEMRSSDAQRLKAKAGIGLKSSKLTIATVHKVKGLQYDTVFVMPSQESFPFRSESGYSSRIDVTDCAEEVRLYYVAMTRAKNKIYGAWGPREASWSAGREHRSSKDARRFFLKGSPGEIFVSWSGQNEQVANGLQEYIESQVCVGDRLQLRGKQLHHDERVVGLLSGKTYEKLKTGSMKSELRVSNVIRYTCGTYFRDNNRDFYERLHSQMKDKGWFYTVLPDED